MYWLMSADAIARIAIAMAFLFLVVPALAWPSRTNATLLQRFFWNIGVGIALLTAAGQLLTLFNLFTAMTLLAVAALVVLLGRSARSGTTPWTVFRRGAENTFLALLNIFDRRVNVPRRIRRRYRLTIAALRAGTESRSVRLQIAGWVALAVIAAGFRLYRPLASANLGFSDTYVHLYLVKLLEEGLQVDPEWGPYPRGMHFLLMAVHHLTNVDQILLMNYFGVFVGVLITLSVAEAARSVTGRVSAGLLAGFLFATLIGGPSQYFVLGGAFAGRDQDATLRYARQPYEELTRSAGEFDLALTAFQRQTSTLSQELAIALLFPAAMFLLHFFRTRERWHLAGFAGCTAAIAAVHSGVVVPLVLMSGLMVIAFLPLRPPSPRVVARAAGFGAAGVLVGSLWTVAFVAYPYAGGKSHASLQTAVATAAFYYFPFLRSAAPDITPDDVRIFVALTPFLGFCTLLALAMAAGSLLWRDETSAGRLWIALVFLLFVTMHFASRLNLPQILPVTRNSQWLLVSMAVLIGVSAAAFADVLSGLPKMRMAAAAVAVAPLFLLWTIRIPSPSHPTIRSRIVDYSGFGGSALAVLRIERSFEPYSWTLISYGQEFPMVLRRGFHLPASDFLERYDPDAGVVGIPTAHVFLIVEKTPHSFEIDTWARRFSRTSTEERLQTWIYLYQATHTNMRVFFEDAHVRVYHIERTPQEIETLSRQARR
jgi:hypothetical protein